MEDGTLAFACSDTVVVGRVENGAFEPIRSDGDIWGHSRVTAATLKVRKVLQEATCQQCCCNHLFCAQLHATGSRLHVRAEAGSLTANMRSKPVSSMSIRPLLAQRCGEGEVSRSSITDTKPPPPADNRFSWPERTVQASGLNGRLGCELSPLASGLEADANPSGQGWPRSTIELVDVDPALFDAVALRDAAQDDVGFPARGESRERGGGPRTGRGEDRKLARPFSGEPCPPVVHQRDELADTVGRAATWSRDEGAHVSRLHTPLAADHTHFRRPDPDAGALRDQAVAREKVGSADDGLEPGLEAPPAPSRRRAARRLCPAGTQ